MPERYIRKPNISCLVCGKNIYRRPIEIRRNNGRVFCSSVCYGKACTKEIPCLVCGQPIRAGLNKKTCSWSCANKNRAGIKYKTGARKDRVKTNGILKVRLFEARGSKCERCGFDKYEILQLHHKDKDRNNNNPDNLEIICPNCHSEEHYLDKSWASRHYN